MECEDTIVLTMKYADGRIGCLRANTISYLKNFEGSLTIFYEKATIKISGTALDRIEYWSGKGSSGKDRFVRKENYDIYGSGHALVYKNFYDCKKNGHDKYITVAEAVNSLRVIESAYKSMRNG